MFTNNDFPYEIPDEKAFMIALIVQLKAEDFENIGEILEGSKCEISRHNRRFILPIDGKWNIFWIEIMIRIPVEKYEFFSKMLTAEIKEVISKIASNLIPKKAGFDVRSVNFTPSIETSTEQCSLVSDLQNASEILSNDLSKEIFPADIKEKGKDMADVYIYLYCVENALRLFIVKIAKETYGDNYFSVLFTNRDIKKKL